MRSILLHLFVFLSAVACAQESVDISRSGWRLWPDRQAAWKDDSLYLPFEVQLSRMEVHPPTDGWDVLDERQGIPVMLPSTVEEHYWGAWGTRPYTKNETQRGAGTSFENGNYLGVSWWWRTIHIPKYRNGQRVIVRFRGARLRAEVYCNGKLCGYSLMEELPFSADITDAVTPGGRAVLAVRITNPGGGLDWIDFAQMQIRWGRYTFPPSHGFGGLDDDIVLEVRDPQAVADLAAINTPDLHKIHLIAQVDNIAAPAANPAATRADNAAATRPVAAGQTHVLFSITRKGVVVWKGERPVTGDGAVAIDAVVPGALPWSTDHPNLYEAHASLEGLPQSARDVTFGFRYFTVEGLGSNARLTLNGKKIVPISAISWGYWGRNGLWPDSAMAEREVRDAKQLGLTCLQFHRNIGKPAVLDVQDRLGLLRTEEPGGGKFALGGRYSKGPYAPDGTFLEKDEGLLKAFDPPKGYVAPDTVDVSGDGPDGDAKFFWEKYEEDKILAMVRRDRSHPSLIMYTVQNESNETDMRNPRIYRLLREMHALDPSRLIVLYSGGNPKTDQAWMQPYNDTIHFSGSRHPYAGWQDVHTCGGPCNYLDFLYKNPTDFRQRQNPADSGNILEWGETLGAATPDNYAELIHSFDSSHPTGYELADMKRILAGYHDFLDRWGFRKAFPTDSSLFASIAYRTYYFWKRIIEQTRIDNNNDFMVISGWESTTIDNHSGLVDNHRFFKGNPTEIAQACKPEELVIEPHHLIVAKGAEDTADVFLINQTGRKGAYRLRVTALAPDGTVAGRSECKVDVTGGDTYGQLLTAGVAFKAPVEGMMTIQASLEPLTGKRSALEGTDTVEVISLEGLPLLPDVAVSEPGDEISRTLRDFFHLKPRPFGGEPASAIILATKGKPTVPTCLDSALEQVHDKGTRLVLWPDDERGAKAFAQALADRHIVQYSGAVGNLNAPWFGSWFFVRRHWLLKGLPVDCAMDWRYGISAFGGPEWLKEMPRGTSTNGLLLDAPGMQAFVGYGADHNTKVGISGCVIPYGKGEILLYCLPQLVRSLDTGTFAIERVVCDRLLGNTLQSTNVFTRAFAPQEAYTKPQERPFRDDTCLNGSWTFQPESGPAGTIRIPSPWNVNSFAAGDRGGDFRTYPDYPKSWDTVHEGWLERSLPLKRGWEGKRLVLHFEAIAGHAQIFINGQKAGEHSDTFLPFDIDVTSLVHWNVPNTLRVHVEASSFFDVRGKYGHRTDVGGSFWGQHIAGIWQDVYLLALPAVHIENTFVEPFVSRDELRVVSVVSNPTDAPRTARLSGQACPWINLAGASVLDAPEPRWKLGAAVLNMGDTTVVIPPLSEDTITLRVRVRGRLGLWSPARPTLYALLTSLDGFDRQYTRFGWREVSIRGKAVLLNGRPIVLKGDSWHFMGIPQMTRRYAWAWFRLLRDAHVNAVRLHAEPYPSFYLDVADEAGMLVLDETGLWASDGGPDITSDLYWTHAAEHVRNFILRDRNHPSVFGWSVCNENIPVAVNVFHAPQALVQRQLAEIDRWVAIARATDPTRAWISGDGETGEPTDLPTLLGHYGNERDYQAWSSQDRPWGIGESGMAYYGTPRQTAAYNGQESYISQFGRMEGVAAEATRLIDLMKKYRAVYRSVFNLVWYGVQPLPFGLADTTRPPLPSDGIFFGPFREGRPGVQPERLGPYTSTLNPGYDPRLPLYRPWPLFYAIQASFGDTGYVAPRPVPPQRAVAEESTGGGPVILLSADPDSTLWSVLRDLGVRLAGHGAARLALVDGRFPPADAASVALARNVAATGGAIAVLDPDSAALPEVNRYLPYPIGLDSRTASSFIVRSPSGPLAAMDNADFYFSELSRRPIARHGLLDPSGNGTVLLDDCNTDWAEWNRQPEFRKTISVLRSERESKPPGPALLAFGKVYVTSIDPILLYQTSADVLRHLLGNLGASFRQIPASAESQGLDTSFVLSPGQAGAVYVNCRLYCPRSLDNLLAEPDLPTIDLDVETKGHFQVFVNGQAVGPKALPLAQGWNHLSVRFNLIAPDRVTLQLRSSNPDFLHELKSEL